MCDTPRIHFFSEAGLVESRKLEQQRDRLRKVESAGTVRTDPARKGGSFATAFHRYISFPGPVNKAVSRERVSVTSWAPSRISSTLFNAFHDPSRSKSSSLFFAFSLSLSPSSFLRLSPCRESSCRSPPTIRHLSLSSLHGSSPRQPGWYVASFQRA